MALYLSTGAAISAALLCAGWGSGSARVGFLGAGVAALGVWTSWQLRHWEQSKRLLLGVLLGSLAGGSLHALITWEITAEIGLLYQTMGYIGLALALRMGVLLAGFSFMLLGRDMLPFSLVPGIAIFGLVGGRGLPSVVFGSFFIFLPAALVSIGQAMMLSGMPARLRSQESPGQISRWWPRHWMMLASMIMVILFLGTVIYIPALTYGTQYYWQLTLMNLAAPGFDRFARAARRPEPIRSYSLGRGPIAPTESPVLSFEGEPAQLWRGEVYDIYTGNAWRSSDERPLPLRVKDGSLSLQAAFPPASRRQLAHYTVWCEQQMPLVLYSPGQIQKATFAGWPGERIRGLIVVDKFGSVAAPNITLPAGASYELVADQLAFERGAGGRTADAGQTPLEELDETYLRIPLSSRRAADIARRVTANAAAPEEKLAALVSYLQQNYAYTLAAPALPAGEDATEYFLFRSRRGYCDLFATALAVMGRAVGIPTRFVTGFAGGQYDPESGRYLLRDSDAHAWVEAYVQPHGWVSVDPAPGGGSHPIPPFQRALLSVRFFLQDYPVPATLGAVAVVVIVLAAIVLRRRREGALLPAYRNDPRSIALRAYARLVRILGRTGRPRRVSQTPLEYLHALQTGGPWRSRALAPLPAEALAPIRSLTDIFLLARYGARPVEAEAAEAALQYLEEARAGLRSPATSRQS